MKTSLLAGAVVAALFAVTANAQSEARTGSLADLTPPGAQAVNTRALLTEGFANVASSPPPVPGPSGCTINLAGWVARNNASPLGSTCVFQGNPASATPPGPFNAQAGPDNSYAAMNFNSTTGDNTISTWLITPRVTFTTGSSLEFWVRAPAAAANPANQAFPDRLQVRVSTAAPGADTDVGTTNTSVGTFTTQILDINPTLVNTGATCTTAGITDPAGGTVTGFPVGAWCRIRLSSASGLPTAGSGRIAFRYFVTNGGPSGANSNFIGIDSFAYEDGVVVVPSVSTPVNTLSIYGLGLLGLMLAGVGIAAARRYA
jgi:hypothetical protein